MHAALPHWPLRPLDQQIDLFNESADLVSRNVERLLTTQVDGCRDWVRALDGQTDSKAQLGSHLDQGLHLGCALFVAQVSAITDVMQLVEKTMADQQKLWLERLEIQPTPVAEPFKKAANVGGCAFDSLSKATRQVANFASNRFAAAAVSALQQARDKLTETT